MLEMQHLGLTGGRLKCCFSSTMKHRLFLLLGLLVSCIFIPSCATGPGGAYPAPSAGLRAGDSASNRIALDEFIGKRPVPGEDRPGLATGWGDEKRSESVPAHFERASSKPAGTDMVFYNDRKGIDSMVRYKERVGPMQIAAGGLVEWGIKGGMTYLPSYKENGWGRRLVAAEKNGTYSIVVKNRCRSALEIVASVDGLDVQDGRTASFSKRGYIVQPGKTLTIDGFRTSHDKVAAFKFSSVGNSYANLRHGDTRNVGVIGIAVFTRKNVDPWEWMPREVDRRATARPFATAP